MQILLHFFIAAADAASAQQGAEQLAQICRGQVGDAVKVRLNPVKRYWKIEGYFESTLRLSVPSKEIATEFFHELHRELGPGWELMADDSAIWNGVSGKHLKVKDVRWAELSIEDDYVPPS